MAVVLDSAGSSLLRHGSSQSCVAHLSSPGSSTRLAFPVCSGLRRIATVSRASSAPSAPQRRSSRAIVCEQQQETIAPSVAGAVNDDTWKELVLDSDVPVLVDFWAPWCGPCRMIAPIIDELALQYAGKVRCLKINTDECPKTATEYGIRSIPTVMIFKGGKKKETIIGAVPRAALTTAIDKFLDR